MEYQFQECQGVGAKKLHKLSYKMIKQKNVYWGINHIYDDFPKITGFPDLAFELKRPYTIKSKIGQRITKIKRAPKKYYLGKLINYPYSRWGAPQIKIIGSKGEGKSVLLNLIMALQAAKGIRILTFNDRRMEIRALAAHGWFDENNDFHPFEIDIFIPKGYEFKKGNPLWDTYDNVTKCEFTSSDEIIQSMEPHKITVVHEEVFTVESKLRLWNDLVEQMAEEIDSKKYFSFTHHELSRLIPETPSSEVNKLVKRAADNLSNFRKDRIGLCSTFHMDSEVFYRVVQKMGYKFQKCPVDKNRYSKLEKEALGYTKQDFAIKGGGRGWMKHSIKLFPELPDEFRLVPQRTKLLYPKMEWEETEDNSKNDTIEISQKLLMMYNMRYVDLMTLEEIGDYFSMPPSTVSYQIKKMSKNMKKSLKATTAFYTQSVAT